MHRVSAGMGVAVQPPVGFHVFKMKMVMFVRGKFRGRNPAMGVIVSVRARCGRVDIVTDARQHRYFFTAVSETHLQRSPDSSPLDGRRCFHQGCALRKPTIALSQSRAYDQRLDRT